MNLVGDAMPPATGSRRSSCDSTPIALRHHWRELMGDQEVQPLQRPPRALGPGFPISEERARELTVAPRTRADSCGCHQQGHTQLRSPGAGRRPGAVRPDDSARTPGQRDAQAPRPATRRGGGARGGRGCGRGPPRAPCAPHASVASEGPGPGSSTPSEQGGRCVSVFSPGTPPRRGQVEGRARPGARRVAASHNPPPSF